MASAEPTPPEPRQTDAERGEAYIDGALEPAAVERFLLRIGEMTRLRAKRPDVETSETERSQAA